MGAVPWSSKRRRTEVSSETAMEPGELTRPARGKDEYVPRRFRARKIWRDSDMRPAVRNEEPRTEALRRPTEARSAEKERKESWRRQKTNALSAKG